MNSQQITNLVQIATGIAVVLGLLLVLYELRQAKALTLAELTSQGYAEGLQKHRTVMGENAAIAISKGCEDPENLTGAELVVLDAFYRAQMGQVSRVRALEQVAEFGVPWPLIARQQLTVILSSEHGRWWFAENIAADPELGAIGQAVLESSPDCKDYYDRFAKRAPADK